MPHRQYVHPQANLAAGPSTIRRGLGLSYHTEVVASLAAYAQWSGQITAGVANLVSQLVAAEQALFGGAEVAKFVFYALTDEFGTGYSGVTHPTLARRLVEKAQQWLGQENQALLHPRLLEKTTNARETSVGILSGYSGKEGLLYSLGFHLASETLAALEFQAIDKALTEDFPSLAEHLQQQRFTENGKTYAAYSWIKFHTHVEEQHRDFAGQAIEAALANFTGSHVGMDKLIGYAQKGFLDFCVIQQRAMQAIFIPPGLSTAAGTSAPPAS